MASSTRENPKTDFFSPGSASLSRMETIMNKLVMVQQPSSPTDELEDTSTHQTPHELAVSVSVRPGSIHELTSPRDPPAELPGGDIPPVSLAEFSPSHELQITAEETIAVKAIFAEAERKFVRQGELPPSRANTVKKPPLVAISRKPLPISKEALHTMPEALHTMPGSRSPTARAQTPTARVQTPTTSGRTRASEDSLRPPPVPAKIPLESPSERQRWSGTLSSSINYGPTPAIEKVLLQYKRLYSGQKNWPSEFKLWLRISEWWFLKVEMIPPAEIYRATSPTTD